MLVVLATVALVALPVAVVEGPCEVARWHVAAAAEHALNDDYAAAVTQMDRAIRWNDKDPELFLQRARYKLEAGQWPSGLEDCDHVRRSIPDDTDVGELRSEFLQHLGRHREAVAEWREIMQAGGSPLPLVRAHQLNGMAYAMAVGALDLEQGLAAVDESLRIIANVPAILDPASVLCFGRAVSAQDSGDNQLALSNVSESRDYAEAALQRITQEEVAEQGQDAHRSLVLTNELQALRAHLAGILELRAQLCDALDKPEEAAQDRQRKKELASDGNLTEAKPYDLSTAIERVSGCASVLDTRGFLLYKLGALDAAYGNVQYAAEACERVCQAMPGMIESTKHFVSDIRPLAREERRYQRTWAVVIYHRMLVLESQGKQLEAAQDRQKIRDMGYEPGDQLF
ncbi:MAG: tetratricopeptide repeat protein [Pirellulaceae bacterium]